MSYRGIGQAPPVGQWAARGNRNGIFGQLYEGSAEQVIARLSGVGAFPTGTVYLEPPYYNDGGLLRIDQQTLPTFKWSVNSTTTVDTNQGSTVVAVPGFAPTYAMEIASVPFGAMGDSWLDTYLADGYVVLYAGKPAEQLGNTLSFAVSKDPKYIAANTAEQANFMMIIDGPSAIINQAKQLVAGLPPTPGGLPSEGGCPPGQYGIPPFCFGTPTQPPGTQPPGTQPPPGPAACGPNQVDILDECFNLPPCPAGEREVLGVCYPESMFPPGTPPGVPPPVQPPPGKPPVQPPPGKPPVQPPPTQAAAAGAPDWLFPVLIGVAGVSVYAIMRAGRKKRRA